MTAPFDGACQLRPQSLGAKLHPVALVLPVAGNEIACSFERDPQLSKLPFPQTGCASGTQDQTSPAWPYPRHTQQHFQRRRVHLHRKQIQMVHCPCCFRIHVHLQVRGIGADDLRYIEFVIAQQPIGLIQPVLSIQLHPDILRQALVGAYRQISAKEHALELQGFIERLRQVENLEIGFRRGSYDHLRGLPCRYERTPPLLRTGGRQIRCASTRYPARLVVLGHVVSDLPHRGYDALLGFLRAQQA